MSTYLIKWNPNKWNWKMLVHDVEQVCCKGFIDDRWSCGNTKRISRGDRVFLMKTGVAPRGIMASGIVTEGSHMATHWDPSRPNDTALCIGVRFDALLDPERDGILAVEQLQTKYLAVYRWHLQSGGITIPPPAAAELEVAWSAFLTSQGQQPISLADEVTTPERFFEGATRKISVNIYERNPAAREKCIKHYGWCCSVCNFNFEQVFWQTWPKIYSCSSP